MDSTAYNDIPPNDDYTNTKRLNVDSTAYDDIPPNDDYTKSWSTQRLLIATHEILPQAVNRQYKRVVNYFSEILILLFL